jgi:hypothetical protein
LAAARRWWQKHGSSTASAAAVVTTMRIKPKATEAAVSYAQLQVLLGFIYLNAELPLF